MNDIINFLSFNSKHNFLFQYTGSPCPVFSFEYTDGYLIIIVLFLYLNIVWLLSILIHYFPLLLTASLVTDYCQLSSVVTDAECSAVSSASGCTLCRTCLVTMATMVTMKEWPHCRKWNLTQHTAKKLCNKDQFLWELYEYLRSPPPNIYITCLALIFFSNRVCSIFNERTVKVAI